MTTRRNFFKLIAGAGLLAVAPRIAMAARAPFLTGDGLADDAPALQALIDGLPVEFGPLVGTDGVGWIGDRFNMPGGAFQLSRSIKFPPRQFLIADGQGSKLIFEFGGFGIEFSGDGTEAEIIVMNFSIWNQPAFAAHLEGVEPQGVFRAGDSI